MQAGLCNYTSQQRRCMSYTIVVSTHCKMLHLSRSCRQIPYVYACSIKTGEGCVLTLLRGFTKLSTSPVLSFSNSSREILPLASLSSWRLSTWMVASALPLSTFFSYGSQEQSVLVVERSVRLFATMSAQGRGPLLPTCRQLKLLADSTQTASAAVEETCLP